MERFEKNPDFLQDLFVEETWKNIERLDSFIESKSGTEQVEITKDEVNRLFRTMHSICLLYTSPSPRD